MAISGAKPKPREIAILHDNKRAAAIINNIPITTTGDLEKAPDFFTETQRFEWDYVIYHSPKSLLKKIDKAILITFVIACDLHRQACLNVAEKGMVVTAPLTGVLMQNPYMAIINRQALIMQKAASEMGFTPTSRSRVSIDKKEKDDNPFLNRGKRNEKS